MFKDSTTEGLLAHEEGQNWKKGENQPAAFRDAPFAVVFVIHVLAIITIVAIYAPETLDQSISGDLDLNMRGYLYVAGATGLLSLIVSSLLVQIMISCASILVKISLLFSVVSSLLLAIFALYVKNTVGFIVSIIFFLLGLCYAKLVWSRIPFATANLVTSLSAIKENFGIIFVSYLFAFLTLAWTILWSLAFYVTYEKTKTCDDKTGDCTMNAGWAFLLFVSLFWTQQVLMNTIHVTVAGTVGTWWFAPEDASSCCSSGVTGSLCRSTTYSFGSICFGSIIVAIIQALQQLSDQARSQGNENAILLCIASCILRCIEGIARFFNKWGFVYVGLYGYGYIEAGKNVMTLFQNRGWEAIIADDLVGNVLFLMSLITGLLFGGVGIILESTTGWFTDTGDGAKTVAFILCFIIGLLLSHIMLSVVASGVNATIVLFAEAPSDFHSNHPELSSNMIAAYNKAYPDLL